MRVKPGRPVFQASRWSRLPRVLEPGVYYVGGARIVVVERIPRDAVRRAVMKMRRRRGKYV